MKINFQRYLNDVDLILNRLVLKADYMWIASYKLLLSFECESSDLFTSAGEIILSILNSHKCV